MPWELQLTPEAENWMRGLSERERSHLRTAFEALEARGPALPRPLADRVKESRYHHMKELRPPRGNNRVLFAFDPNRRAVILLGGDKTGQWNKWYRTNIPRADRLYEGHLRGIGKAGNGNAKETAWRQGLTGERSSGR